LSVASFAALVLMACATQRPFLPTIEANANWQLSEACRVYQYGFLTDPACDVLTSEGIVISVTRIRLLNLQAGQDNRATIGIEFEPKQANWYLSSPYATLEVGGKRYEYRRPK